MVAAGGTGGDLFPAMAVAEKIKLLTAGNCDIQFIGTPNRIESEKVPQAGYKFHPINISGLQKFLSISTLKIPFQLVYAIVRCLKLILSQKSSAVLCAGFYVGLPVGIAANILGIPVFVIEPNAFPSKTVRQLAPKARRIFTAFEETKNYFKDKIRQKFIVAGNPIRANFSILPAQDKSRKLFGLLPNKRTILIFGGSLGAISINSAVEQLIPKLVANNIQVIWQIGKKYIPAILLPDSLVALQFIDEMPTAYSAADVVICRAGAGSIAELCVVGKPSILIPLPSAAGNHQEKNGIAMEKVGSAIVLKDNELGAKLYEVITTLLADEKRREAMSVAAKNNAKPDAAESIARTILELLQIKY